VPLSEACECLRTCLPDVRHGAPVQQYRSDAGIVEAMLTQNAKLSKEAEKARAHMTGLSLAPNTTWARSHEERRWRTGVRADTQVHDNLCVGATDGCRKACLVSSGHGVEKFNMKRKRGLTRALVNYPLHFLRVLVEAIEKFEQEELCFDFNPWVRLNTFSDIPWEVVIPDLFEYFQPTRRDPKRVGFYDYTKVTGRGPNPTGNYDLTFSLSEWNRPQATEALEDGMRLAVVFVGKQPTPGEKLRWENGELYKVANGDDNDYRPGDPAPSIVALSYKSVKGVRLSSLQPEVFNFVNEVEREGFDPIWGLTPDPKRERQPRKRKVRRNRAARRVSRQVAFLVHAFQVPGGYLAVDGHRPMQTNAYSALDEEPT
jgi:hypothetical protein